MASTLKDFEQMLLWEIQIQGGRKTTTLKSQKFRNLFLDAWWDTDKRSYDLYYNDYQGNGRNMVVSFLAKASLGYQKKIEVMFAKANKAWQELEESQGVTVIGTIKVPKAAAKMKASELPSRQAKRMKASEKTTTVNKEGKTSCCNAFTSIHTDTGQEYCKKCYRLVK